MPNGENGIEYNYSEDKIPTVQDGIVIEDEEGNQFVWVPVGEIKNKKGDKNGEKTEITLGRYTFGEDGTPSEAHDGSYVISSGSSYSHIEDNWEEFKTSAEINHGYYIARYEAGNNNGKVISKQGQVWNYIVYSDALNVSQEMYEKNSNYASNLINSFAWDTALVFIQKYSGDDDYSMQNARPGSEPLNTGEREESTDKVCNIYDMASNCWEASTEITIGNGDMHTKRGGVFNGDYTTAGYRGSLLRFTKEKNYGFRVVLYILQ